MHEFLLTFTMATDLTFLHHVLAGQQGDRETQLQTKGVTVKADPNTEQLEHAGVDDRTYVRCMDLYKYYTDQVAMRIAEFKGESNAVEIANCLSKASEYKKKADACRVQRDFLETIDRIDRENVQKAKLVDLLNMRTRMANGNALSAKSYADTIKQINKLQKNTGVFGVDLFDAMEDMRQEFQSADDVHEMYVQNPGMEDAQIAILTDIVGQNRNGVDFSDLAEHIHIHKPLCAAQFPDVPKHKVD